MNSVDTLLKRLHDETAMVEKEIQSHNQQVEFLSRRLEGLKRAAELFDSEQAAIAELLQASTANRNPNSQQMATVLAARRQKLAPSPKATPVRQTLARNTQISLGKTKIGSSTQAAGQKGALTRVDMIAAVLRRHPGRSVRQLIALLNKEYRWKTTDSAVTGHLYTRRDMFVHTPPDRTTNRPVTWSSK
jgi:hypothetical protein